MGAPVASTEVMVPDQRATPRVSVALECSWASHARLADLSMGGCYIDCPHTPALGDAVEVSVTLDDVPTALQGTAIHVRRGLGFALEFSGMEVSALEQLRAFLAKRLATEHAS
jgi:hypothetical protein